MPRIRDSRETLLASEESGAPAPEPSPAGGVLSWMKMYKIYILAFIVVGIVGFLIYIYFPDLKLDLSDLIPHFDFSDLISEDIQEFWSGLTLDSFFHTVDLELRDCIAPNTLLRSIRTFAPEAFSIV